MGDEDRLKDEKGLLWKTLEFVVEQLDTGSVEEKIRGLREGTKGITNSKLVGCLVREKAVKSGLVAGLTSLPANIPILGTLATLSLGTAVDLATLMRYECQLVVEVACVYGCMGGRFQSTIDILSVLSAVAGDERAQRDLERIKLTAVGDQAIGTATRQLLNKLAVRIGGALVAKSSARAVPVLGALIGAGINYSALVRVGEVAERYFTGRAARG